MNRQPNELVVRVIPYEMPYRDDTVSCWLYLSDGLERRGHAEILFCLQRQAADRVAPEEPVQWLRQMDRMAQTGQQVKAGAVLEFKRDFFGRHLCFTRAPALPGVRLPANTLCALLITRDELEAACEFGITRLLARLGQAANYYPYPPWSDPNREGLGFDDVRAETMLRDIKHLEVRGGCVYDADNRVVLRLTEGAGDLLAEKLPELPEEVVFALLTEWPPDADGCGVWMPGQTRPIAIRPPHSQMQRVCGCFLVIATGQTDEGVRWVEDGFDAALTPISWFAFRDAIIKRQPLEIPSTDSSMPLVLEWQEAGSPRPQKMAATDPDPQTAGEFEDLAIRSPATPAWSGIVQRAGTPQSMDVERQGKLTVLKCRTPGEACLIADELEAADIVVTVADEEAMNREFKREGLVTLRVSAQSYEAARDVQQAIDRKQWEAERSQQPLSFPVIVGALGMGLMPFFGLLFLPLVKDHLKGKAYERKAQLFERWFCVGFGLFLMLIVVLSILIRVNPASLLLRREPT